MTSEWCRGSRNRQYVCIQTISDHFVNLLFHVDVKPDNADKNIFFYSNVAGLLQYFSML